MFGRSSAIVGGIATLFGLTACGSDADTSAEVVLMTQEGPWGGTLSIDPNPPHVGQHRVVITLDESAEHAALEGAEVLVSPWMPAHGHGTTDVEAVEEAPGVYVAENVWFNMPGIWDLRVHVDADDAGDLIATVEVP
jgi:hypothetical protein